MQPEPVTTWHWSTSYEYRPTSEHAPIATTEDSGGKGLWFRVAGSLTFFLVSLGGLVAYIAYFQQDQPKEEGGVMAALQQLQESVQTMAKRRDVKKQRAANKVDRGPIPNFADVRPRAPSLFVNDEHDRNRDGRIQPPERAAIHGTVPQFIVITVNGSGSAEGLTWLAKQAKQYRFEGQVSYFGTTDYLKGRDSYLGGHIDQSWQKIVHHDFMGIHGTSLADGGESWDTPHWQRELQTMVDETARRTQLPKDWALGRIPVGESRTTAYGNRKLL